MSIFSLPGVHAPHRKNTKDIPAVTMPAPVCVTIPTVMHIGAPATITVKVGDHVDVGQLIAEAGGAVSAPIHASISGTVKKIDSILQTDGKAVPAIVIESDGNMTPYANLTPPSVTDRDSFLAAVRASGVVGLGGAGFPTAVKLSVDPARIEEILVNGAECEPYITSDNRTMIDDADLVAEGLALLEKHLGAKKITVCIEKNKPAAIRKMREATASMPFVRVLSLPSIYPQGGEKVLIRNTTGKTVPEGKLPIDVGVIVLNCTTVSTVARYIRTGMPLVSKCVTVDGSAVKEPKNVIAPIGTPVSDLFAFCGGFKDEPKKVLYGGPMMGIALTSLDAPVIKNTNAVLAFAGKDACEPEPTACIRCGKCAEHCPVFLTPVAISNAYQHRDGEMLKKLKVNLCMGCGCCSYICPARRPLVQTNRLAKTFLEERKKAEKEKEEAAK